MNDLSSQPLAAGAKTLRELAELISIELRMEATTAPEQLKPLYRWMLDAADAFRPIPSWGSRPHLSKIVGEMGISQRRLPDMFSATVARWHPRFLEAFDTDRSRALMPKLANGSAVTPEQFADPVYRASLVHDLKQVRQDASKRLQRCYDWLIERAEAGEPMPVYAHRPNILSISRIMGVSNVMLSRADATRLFAFWLPRFLGEEISATVVRTALPGTELVGPAVPTGLLVKEMRKASASEPDRDARQLIEHLVSVAQGERAVPRFNRMPNYKELVRDAAISPDANVRKIEQIFRDWIGFFRLEDHTTFRDRTGLTVTRPDSIMEITQYLDRLRAGGMVKLQYTNYRNNKTVSIQALAAELGVPADSLKQPRPRKIIDLYYKECRDHYGDGNEFGDIYKGISAIQKMELAEFRSGVVEYIKKEIKAGRALPAHPIYQTKLDLDEVVRRFGRSGPSLHHNDRFKVLLRKLDPDLQPYEVTAVPSTYAQLVERLQQERLPLIGKNTVDPVNRKKSVSVTKSKIKSAIEMYAGWNQKTLTDQIGEDFVSAKFTETVAGVRISGIKQFSNWEREINAAKLFIETSSAPGLEEDRFEVILMNAIVKSGRSFRAIATSSGITENLLRDLAYGRANPTRDERHLLVKIEEILDIPDLLTNHLSDRQPRRTGRGSVPIPAGVREFLPDNYRTRPKEELEAMIVWIQENLLRSNTPFGNAMSTLHKRRFAKMAKDDSSASTSTAENPSPAPKMHPAIGTALNKQLKHETTGLGHVVVGELAGLIKHMIEFLPSTLERRPGSHWKAESTAPMRLSLIARFLRWQVMDEEEGGLGRDPDDLTLGDLIHPPLVFAYLDFKARRNENVEHEGRKRGKRFTGTDVDILRAFGALLADIYGFVTQSPEMARRIRPDKRSLDNGSFIRLDGHIYDDGENERQDKEDSKFGSFRLSEHEVMPRSLSNLSAPDFLAACAKAKRMYATAQAQIDLYAEAGRDPAELIEGLLDSERPMALLLRQLALASQRIPPIQDGKQAHHLAIRDLLICRLLALTSLRSKNLREITVDGADPKLRRERLKDGRRAKFEDKWLLEIHWSEFKNFRSAVIFGRRRKRQPYRKALPDTQQFYALLEYYLEHSRPYFLRRQHGKGQPELFLTMNGHPFDGPNMYKAIATFTSRHMAWNPFREEGIPNVQPFGPHAFRDVRATDILLHPRTSNPYLEAALAIQTSPAMVQSHYGVVKSERRAAEDDETFVRSEKQAWSGMDDSKFRTALGMG